MRAQERDEAAAKTPTGARCTVRGVVKWFDANRGYGFILPQEGGADVFLHRRVLQATAGLRRLEPGQRVEYEVADTPHGRKVTRIRVLPPEEL